jgi:hypothetical protein
VAEADGAAAIIAALGKLRFLKTVKSGADFMKPNK